MKAIEAFLIVIGLLLLSAILLAFPTMWLWNWLMPNIFGVMKIDLYQAIGINFLTHILFKSNITIKRENNGN
jgi:phosphoglycerol transferase MdoB-like AlkP superfamily enzyme